MKRATIADAPAVLNTNDKAMWVLGFNDARNCQAVDLKPWEKPRFGVFHPDGRFEELPVEGWDNHPLAHTARWVGGIADMQLLRAALAADVRVDAPAQPAAPNRAHKWDVTGERCVLCGDKDWMGGTCSGPRGVTPPDLVQRGLLALRNAAPTDDNRISLSASDFAHVRKALQSAAGVKVDAA